MNSHPPSDAERVEIANAAEEILLHVRQVARRMQRRLLKVLGGSGSPPGAGEPRPAPDAPSQPTPEQAGRSLRPAQ
jgi:hypothetical protein